MDPRLSVVIPTHNRRASVERLLGALAGQTCGPDAFEVIVVADGCSDGTESAVAERVTPFACSVRPLAHAGPARSRNEGAAAARAPLLLFLDDDIEPNPGLLAAHLAAAEGAPRQATVGYLPPRLVSQRGFFRTLLAKWWEGMFAAMRDPGHRVSYTDFLTGNVSLPTALFRELGGFDESFRVHEDYEFGYRLLAAGGRIVFRPDAWGHHHEGTDLARAFRRKRDEGRADVQLATRHPELAPQLPYARLQWELTRRQRLGMRLARAWPWAADRWIGLVQARLAVDEFFAQRAVWERRVDRLLRYWYWRGVAEAGGPPAGGAVPAAPASAEFDLALGVDAVCRAVDELRPAAVTLRLGPWPIGTIPGVAGTEPLRGDLVRAALARELAWPFLTARAVTQGSAERRAPAVTVVVPFRNAADTLEAALDSLRRQQFAAWEAVLVDDGSADGSRTIAERFAALDPRFRIVPGGGGKSRARNEGIAAGRGEWILFLDADDELTPPALARLIAAAGAGVDAVLGWSVLIAPDGRELAHERPPTGPDLFAIAAERCPAPIHAWLVRRERVAAAGGFDPNLETCEDWDLWQRLTRIGLRCTAVPDQVARYRFRHASATSDVRRLLADASPVIRRGHGADPRLAGRAQQHPSGAPAARLGTALLQHLVWAVGMLIGRGEHVQDLATAPEVDREVGVDGTLLGEILLGGVLRGAFAPPAVAPAAAATAHDRAAAFAAALAGQLEQPGLERQIMLAYEDRALRHAARTERFRLGRTVAVPLDLERPVEDLVVPADVERVLLLPRYGSLDGPPVGMTAVGGRIDAAVIRQAVAGALAWPILGEFLHASVVPALSFAPAGPGTWSVARAGRTIASAWHGDPADRTGLHDAIGWTLLVQELVGDPGLDPDRLYTAAGGDGEPADPGRPPIRLTVEFGRPIEPPAAEPQWLGVDVTIGGRTVASVPYRFEPGEPPDRGTGRLLRYLGYDLVVAVTREALLGAPIDGPPLRERLDALAARGAASSTPANATHAGRLDPDWLVWPAAAPAPPVEDRHFFEARFATAADPWHYQDDYEQLKYRQTLALLPEGPIGRALELGCAEGTFTAMLAPRVGRLVAADIATVALDRARERCRDLPNVDYRQLDFGADPIPGGQDLIVCSESLYYLGGRDQLRAVAARIAEALAPGGTLVLAHANAVADDPDRPGFDWGTPYGARIIGETFASIPGLRWRREWRTPYYRIQRFERGDAGARDTAAEETVDVEYAPPNPGVRASFRWTGGPRPRSAPAPFTHSVPILMYHRIGAEPADAGSRYVIGADTFARQLEHLAAAGFRTLTADQWRRAAESRRPVPARSFLLTFDDGYQDFADLAWPICRAHGFVPIVFLVSGAVGGGNHWDAGKLAPAPLMDWPVIRRLAAAGVDFGSHAVSHRSLLRLAPDEALRELSESKRELETRLDVPVTAVSYPYGDADAGIRNLAALAGYRLGFGIEGRRALLSDDRFALPRLEVRGDRTFETFLAALAE